MTVEEGVRAIITSGIATPGEDEEAGDDLPDFPEETIDRLRRAQDLLEPSATGEIYAAVGPGVRMTVDDVAADFVQSLVDDHGFLSWLGVDVTAVAEGRVVLTVPYDERLVNDTQGVRGGVHGGVAATLVDTAGGVALGTLLGEAGRVATVDLSVSYLEAATGDLVATAEVVRAGTTVGVARVDVESGGGDDSETVAVGQGSYRLFRGDGE